MGPWELSAGLTILGHFIFPRPVPRASLGPGESWRVVSGRSQLGLSLGSLGWRSALRLCWGLPGEPEPQHSDPTGPDICAGLRGLTLVLWAVAFGLYKETRLNYEMLQTLPGHRWYDSTRDKGRL